MFTSRAEFRLSLRADNADQRLTPMAIELGCVGRTAPLGVRGEDGPDGRRPRHAGGQLVPRRNSGRPGSQVKNDGVRRTAFDVLSFPDVTEEHVLALLPDYASVAPEIRRQLGREALYANYLDRQTADAEALRRDEAVTIPEDFDYGALAGLSNELKLKLMRDRPVTLAQAARIEGMTPAALTLILAHLRRGEKRRSA